MTGEETKQLKEKFDRVWESNYLNGWSNKKAKERNAVWQFILDEIIAPYEIELLAGTSEDCKMPDCVLHKFVHDHNHPGCSYFNVFQNTQTK